MPDIFDESTKELYALVKDSERCANEIFSACENIQKQLNKIDEKTAEAINSQIVRIIESCHFQDFAGQRTKKVVSHLRHGKEQVGQIETKVLSAEESLTQGPQVEIASQEEIDKLFNEA